MALTNEAFSQDLEAILGAAENYKQSKAGASTQLVQKLEAMKVHVEGPSTYLARMRYQPILNMCVSIAQESGMLRAVVKRHGQPISSREVASETGQDETFVTRIMRQLFVNGVCEELGPSTFGSNAITELLDTPEHRGACKVLHELGLHIGSNLPTQLRTCGIQMFSDKPGNKTPFEFTYGMSWFEYLMRHPEMKEAFDNYMRARKGDIQSSWVDLYPVTNLLPGDSATSTEVTLVDVSGGTGEDLLAFRNRCSEQCGRLVLEELPETLQRVEDLPADVEKVEYNFFTIEQPVKGARAYFMHMIMHDWSDEQARAILHSTAKAMTKDSVLLMQDMVLPDTGCSWRGSTLDILMLLFPGGMERSRGQWEDLCDSAGLEIVKVWTDEKMIEFVVEARLKR